MCVQVLLIRDSLNKAKTFTYNNFDFSVLGMTVEHGAGAGKNGIEADQVRSIQIELDIEMLQHNGD